MSLKSKDHINAHKTKLLQLHRYFFT